MADIQRGWLDERSPMHREFDWLWEMNERRFEGGHRVRHELWRFDWETLPLSGMGTSDPALLRDGATIPWPSASRRTTKTKDVLELFGPLAPGEHYTRRQNAAIYVNFMEAFASDLVGHLFKQAPAPDNNGLDFGTLGPVRRKKDIDTPTRAELLYYNTDGVGVDGSQWDSYWASQLKLAMATGFRWQYVEAPPEAPRTRGRERRGLRPYFISFSPRQVINHVFLNGRLEWAVVNIGTRRPRVNENGGMTGNDGVTHKLLLVRAGNTDLGAEFASGGWFRFDENKDVIDQGMWERTEGEIPMFPLVYDRHPDMIGRPALTELGHAAIALMNVASAADFDAFDGAGSIKAVRGADKNGYNFFIRMIKKGHRYPPLVTNVETNKAPELDDASMGSVVAQVFAQRTDSIMKMVDRIKGDEMTSVPSASGLAQQAGFAIGTQPRLSTTASNIETAMNTGMHFAEQRFGETNPSGSAIWSKKFEAIKLVATAQQILQLEAIAGIHSEELEARVILAAARDEGVVPDNAVAQTIESELRASRKEADARVKATALAKQNGKPDVPGSRRRNMPPEPAQTNDAVKTQLDGPNVE